MQADGRGMLKLPVASFNHGNRQDTDISFLQIYWRAGLNGGPFSMTCQPTPPRVTKVGEI